MSLPTFLAALRDTHSRPAVLQAFQVLSQLPKETLREHLEIRSFLSKSRFPFYLPAKGSQQETAHTLAMVIRPFALIHLRDDALFRQVAADILDRRSHLKFEPSDLLTLAFSYGKFRLQDCGLSDWLAWGCRTHFDKFSLRELISWGSSLSRMNYQNPIFFNRFRSRLLSEGLGDLELTVVIQVIHVFGKARYGNAEVWKLFSQTLESQELEGAPASELATLLVAYSRVDIWHEVILQVDAQLMKGDPQLPVEMGLLYLEASARLRAPLNFAYRLFQEYDTQDLPLVSKMRVLQAAKKMGVEIPQIQAALDAELPMTAQTKEYEWHEVPVFKKKRRSNRIRKHLF